MGSKDFLKKVKNAQDAWEEGRKSAGGGMVEVDDGFKGIVRGQSIEFSATDDGIPFVHINTIVVSAPSDEDVGKRVAARFRIEHRKGEKNGKKWEITEADCLAQVARALKAFGMEVDDMDLDAQMIEEVTEYVSEEQPACRITVKENAGGYKNVKWGQPVDDDDLPALEDVLDESDDDDVDDEEDDVEDDDVADDDDDMDEEDDDDDEEDDDEIEPPSKGDVLAAKPKGARKVEEYKVLSVNKTKETVTLVRERDKKKFTNQSWEVLA